MHGAVSPAFAARTKAYTAPADIYPGRPVLYGVYGSLADGNVVDTDNMIVSVDCEPEIGEVPGPSTLALSCVPRCTFELVPGWLYFPLARLSTDACYSNSHAVLVVFGVIVVGIGGCRSCLGVRGLVDAVEVEVCADPRRRSAHSETHGDQDQIRCRSHHAG